MTVFNGVDVNLNKATLQLMQEMDNGKIYRTVGGRDVRRGQHFNNPIGGKGKLLISAGLATANEVREIRLTVLGQQEMAKAVAGYEQKSVNSRAEVKAAVEAAARAGQ